MLKFKNRHLLWFSYLMLFVGVGNLFINLDSRVKGLLVLVSGNINLEPRTIFGGLLLSLIDLLVPTFLIVGSLCELFLPKMTLAHDSLEIRDQWFPKRRRWAWNEVQGVEQLRSENKKEVTLEFRVAKYDKRKVYLSFDQAETALAFILGKMPEEKLDKVS